MTVTGLASLVIAICTIESNLNPKAINFDDKGEDSLGLCQIKLSTAKHLGFTGTRQDLLDNPTLNKLYAKKYLLYQLKRYDWDINKAISAYNGGSACNNKSYVRKVINLWILNVHPYQK